MAKVSNIAKQKTMTDKIVDKMVIKDRIQRVYAACSREMMSLKKAKREAGYCGGSPSCLVYTGEEMLCTNCKRNKGNPKSSRPLMEYGKIRQQERAADKKKTAPKVLAPKRKAA